MKVLVASNHEYAGIIQDILGETVEVVLSDTTTESILEKGRDADIIASNRVPRELLESGSGLKMVQTFAAGVENIDFSAIKDQDNIIVCNSHINAAEVAEYAITLLFAVAKNIIPSDRELRKGDWKYALKGFDVRIYATTRSGNSKHAGLVDKLVKINEVQPLVEESDFIILSLPLTSESEGLVNGEFISWMKSDSIIVNISRGRIIDEEALFDALRDNRIRGAGLDVWWRYPQKWRGKGNPPSDVPFQELENLVASPHRAGYSETTEREYFQFAGENILRFINGETPFNIVDFHRGY